jgi:neutral ceramidase
VTINDHFYLQVIEKLRKSLPGEFDHDNVMLSATHTHAGPAGYMQYLLFNIPCLGFVKQSMEAMVTGIVRVRRQNKALHYHCLI